VNIHILCKRHYTNKDLLEDRFGRLYHLPVQLAALGAQVSVNAIDYRRREPQTLEESGVRFHSEPSHPTRLLSVVPRLYRAARNARPDVIIASGDSHIGYLGFRIARKLNARFVFDVYDYYPVFPGNRIPGMKAMFRSAATNADWTLCVSEVLQERLYPLTQRSLLIPNGVDPTLFNEGDRIEARARLGLGPNNPIIGFFGSMGSSKGPILLDACRLLHREMPDLRLLVAGRVENVAIDFPWVTYFGEVSQAAIPPLIAACDVVAVPLAHHPQNDVSGSCKIAEYLACGRPVVATRVSNHEELFRSAPGSICEPNANSMAEALRRQLRTPEIAPFPEGMTWKAIAQTLHRELVALAG
jgi:glycosyltransferase involved in cell wall biosynthesis